MCEIWRLGDYKGRTALIDDQGDSLTYDEMNIETCAIANHISKRSLVFCLCKNEIGSIVGYVGFVNNNIVPVHDKVIVLTSFPFWKYFKSDPFNEITLNIRFQKLALDKGKNIKEFIEEIK